MIEYVEVVNGRVEKDFIVNSKEFTIKTEKVGVFLVFKEGAILLDLNSAEKVINLIKKGKNLKIKSIVKENNIVTWLFNGWRPFKVFTEFEIVE